MLGSLSSSPKVTVFSLSILMLWILFFFPTQKLPVSSRFSETFEVFLSEICFTLMTMMVRTLCYSDTNDKDLTVGLKVECMKGMKVWNSFYQRMQENLS